jgi:hypothetical protein
MGERLQQESPERTEGFRHMTFSVISHKASAQEETHSPWFFILTLEVFKNRGSLKLDFNIKFRGQARKI